MFGFVMSLKPLHEVIVIKVTLRLPFERRSRVNLTRKLLLDGEISCMTWRFLDHGTTESHLPTTCKVQMSCVITRT